MPRPDCRPLLAQTNTPIANTQASAFGPQRVQVAAEPTAASTFTASRLPSQAPTPPATVDPAAAQATFRGCQLPSVANVRRGGRMRQLRANTVQTVPTRRTPPLSR